MKYQQVLNQIGLAQLLNTTQGLGTKILLLTLAMLSFSSIAKAEFQLNFQPENRRLEDPEWLNFNCNRGGGGGEDNGFEDCDDNDEFRDDNGRDRTAFLMERVRDPGSGDQYYHVILGLPGDDFQQEAYIKITRVCSEGDDGGGGCRVVSRIPSEIDDLGPISDSLGDWSDISERDNNAYDPLGPAAFSGSGTANPNSTQFWQIIEADGIFQDIKKEAYALKPDIIQTLDDNGVTAEFELRMSNSNYNQDNIAGIMERNSIRVTDGDFVSEFDINDIDSPGSVIDVTGGKFKYESRYDNTLSGGSFESEYSGEGAGFNIFEADWKIFYDPSQNIGNMYGCHEDCYGPRVRPNPSWGSSSWNGYSGPPPGNGIGGNNGD